MCFPELNEFTPELCDPFYTSTKGMLNFFKRAKREKFLLPHTISATYSIQKVTQDAQNDPKRQLEVLLKAFL